MNKAKLLSVIFSRSFINFVAIIYGSFFIMLFFEVIRISGSFNFHRVISEMMILVTVFTTVLFLFSKTKKLLKIPTEIPAVIFGSFIYVSYIALNLVFSSYDPPNQLNEIISSYLRYLSFFWMLIPILSLVYLLTIFSLQYISKNLIENHLLKSDK